MAVRGERSHLVIDEFLVALPTGDDEQQSRHVDHKYR